MKRMKLLNTLLLVVMLFCSSIGNAFAAKSDNPEDVIYKFDTLSDKFVTSIKTSEWVHSVIVNEFKDRPTVEMEDWYYLGKNGKIKEIYEWSSFGDTSTPSQESMMKEGYWINLTSKQKWHTSSDDIDFTSEFRTRMRKVLSRGERIQAEEVIVRDIAIVKFSIDTADGAYENVKGFREEFLLASETGEPIEITVVQINKDGSEELQARATYEIEHGILPPSEKIKKIKDKTNKEGSSYDELGGINNQVALAAITYYKTDHRSENVVVSGLSVTSYKTIYPYTNYFTANMYTGTPSTLLQEAGANWFSFQEYCNGTYFNKYINTTPVIRTGVTHWYTSTGVVYYMKGCNKSHELYVNGSHYAKYNWTIMNPSPNFSIWWPVALTNP